MTNFDAHNDLPDDLRDVERRLRDAVPSASPAELDQLKQRAMRQARASRPKRNRSLLTPRWLSLGLAAAILGGTAATGVASGGFTNWGWNGNAAVAQYRPYHCYRHHNGWAEFGGAGQWCHHQGPPPGGGTTSTQTTTTIQTVTDAPIQSTTQTTTTSTQTSTQTTTTSTQSSPTGPPHKHHHKSKPIHRHRRHHKAKPIHKHHGKPKHNKKQHH